MALLKKVKDIKQYGFSGRTGSGIQFQRDWDHRISAFLQAE